MSPQRVQTFAQFQELPPAPLTMAFTQMPPVSQWVYACPGRGCMECYISDAPNAKRTCSLHSGELLRLVGTVLKHRGKLYARHQPARV